MQFVFHFEQFVALTGHHLGHRNAGRAADHFGDFFRANLRAQQTVLRSVGLRFGLRGILQFGFQLRQLTILQLGHLFKFAFALQPDNFGTHMLDFFFQLRRALCRSLFRLPYFFQIGVLARKLLNLGFNQRITLFRGFVFFLFHRFPLDFKLDQAALQLIHHFRLGIDFHSDPCCGLIDQIDRLVRQETVGDVAVRQLCCGDDGRIGDVHPVMQLIPFLQTAQYGDSGLHRRFVHQHLLETAFQRGILLDVLAVFIKRSRAHAVQFAAR